MVPVVRNDSAYHVTFEGSNLITCLFHKKYLEQQTNKQTEKFDQERQQTLCSS